ncbi:hypothetical protein GIB67_036750 [Kingdonia uniflora]|uniref:Nucleotidyl transferase domain-containing protein n=1 Tax=Kingdonia uniflora TaxID=39325 RepID=A0A7J7LWJ2_9MAGN|nr:hypothetical protein GIB67_036750 [Kingdonia uniflora]
MKTAQPFAFVSDVHSNAYDEACVGWPRSPLLPLETVASTLHPHGESGKKWFQGTTDAVRQFAWLFEDTKHRHTENNLILSGDHLYRMDYMDFVQKHIDSGADISVSCFPMNRSRASDIGLMKIDKSGRIRQFLEKPKGEDLKSMVTTISHSFLQSFYLQPCF